MRRWPLQQDRLRQRTVKMPLEDLSSSNRHQSGCSCECARALGGSGVREREIFIHNLLVRVHLIIEMSRPALRHGSLNFLLRYLALCPVLCGPTRSNTASMSYLTRVEERVGPFEGNGTKCQLLKKVALNSRIRQSGKLPSPLRV